MVNPLLDIDFDNTIWSYTKLKSFEDCPYQFYLKYIRKDNDKEQFYASYGSFMHKLIAEYYNDQITREEMLTKYYKDFATEVRGARPKESTLEKYIDQGANYISSFLDFPYDTVAVEQELTFDIDGLKFNGFLDYLGRDTDGSLVLIDHKSSDLKPKSGRNPPLVRDVDIDKRLRQLYIYSYAIKDKYGDFPAKMYFNCFRNGNMIEERFNPGALQEAIQWVKDTVQAIKNTIAFKPVDNAFYCKWICHQSDSCEPRQKVMDELMNKYQDESL